MKSRFFFILAAIATSFIIACSTEDDINTTDSQELYRIQVGGKYGFINEKGKLIIEPQYDRAYWFFGDSVCYAEVGERKGLINTNGEFVVDLEISFSWVYKFRNGIAVFRDIYGKEGLITKSGEIILPSKYQNIWEDNNTGFIVEDTLGNQGYMNMQGVFIVPCKYDAVGGFNEGLMVVATSDKCGYVDTTGTWVIDSIYDDARGFGDGLARVKINEKWQFIDKSGKAVEELSFDDILTIFANNRAFAKEGNAIMLIDKNGRKIATIDADSVWGFREGYATFKRDERYGIIDTAGTTVIQPTHEKLSWTEDGLSPFCKNGKWGVIDVSGKIIVDAVYEDMSFDNCRSLILCVNNNWTEGTYYDKNGKLIWKDMPVNNTQWPQTRKECIRYLDSRLSDLDPIEGIYYVTFDNVAVNRENDHITSNGSSSSFFFVIHNPHTNDYVASSLNNNDSIKGSWVKKFVKIGDTNAYAIVNSVEDSQWAEDGKLILEDSNLFNFSLRLGGNDYYNWHVQCEFMKDYPSPEIYEQVQKTEWSGTGFAIADGYVVTNYHVTTGAKTISVKGVNGEINDSFKGYVVASDREHDLAIIKIVDKRFDGFENIPYCLGKGMPEEGDDIFVLGYPLTETMGNDIKLTNGIISASSGYKGDQSMYQISAAVQPGNSGGPLFDYEGNVIGIVCAKHADAENANYAIKVSYLLSLINCSSLEIKLSGHNNIKSKSLSKKVKQVKPFVYLIECSSH